MNKKNCFRARKGGVTHKKLRMSLVDKMGGAERERERERWLNRNDRSSWGGREDDSIGEKG